MNYDWLCKYKEGSKYPHGFFFLLNTEDYSVTNGAPWGSRYGVKRYGIDVSDRVDSIALIVPAEVFQ